MKATPRGWMRSSQGRESPAQCGKSRASDTVKGGARTRGNKNLFRAHPRPFVSRATQTTPRTSKKPHPGSPNKVNQSALSELNGPEREVDPVWNKLAVWTWSSSCPRLDPFLRPQCEHETSKVIMTNNPVIYCFPRTFYFKENNDKQMTYSNCALSV